MPRQFRHTKTGRRYALLFIAINATNGQEDQEIAVYQHVDGGPYFTRELKEFYLKFTEI
jgi:hypothetical protein